MQKSILTFKARLVLAMLFLTLVVGGSVPPDSHGRRPRAPRVGVPHADPVPVPSVPVPRSAFDNKGVEFVLGFEANNTTGGSQTIFITGDVATSGMVTVPGLNQPFLMPFAVTPGAITSVDIPTLAQVTSNDLVEAKGVLVEAVDEIAVYGLNQENQTTDGFLGLPTDIMGTEHIVLSFGAGASTPSQFMIVGIVDGTNVTITPSVTTGTRVAGVPYTIKLNRLNTYQLQTNAGALGDDLSGSIITSDKSVTVFGSVQCADVPAGVSFCDHLVEQLPSTSTWGTHFFTVPLATRTGGDIFRVIARDNATTVTVDGGAPVTLNRSEFRELDLGSGTFHEIMATSPVMVMQYSKGSASDGVVSDPFMMLIPPTEQFRSAYTVATPAASPVSFNNFINLVVADGDLGSCTVDGGALTAAAVSIGSSGYSAVQQSVGVGAHSLSCATPFGAYSYGWASSDSYGYAGGLGLAPTSNTFPLRVEIKRVKAKQRLDRVDQDFIAIWGNFFTSLDDPNTAAIEPTSDWLKVATVAGRRVIDEPITVSYFDGVFSETIPAGLLIEDPLFPDVYNLEAFPFGTVGELSIDFTVPGDGGFKLGFDAINLELYSAILNASDPKGDNMPVVLGLTIGNDAGSVAMGYHVTNNRPGRLIQWEGQ